jgi:addiction module HigA family antidote
MKRKLSPVTPGEVLREEFLVPFKLSAHRLAIALRVPAPRINDIVNDHRAITPDTAIRLGRFFNTSPRFWMTLQTNYELRRLEERVGPEIVRDIRPIQDVPAISASPPATGGRRVGRRKRPR